MKEERGKEWERKIKLKKKFYDLFYFYFIFYPLYEL